MKGLKNILLKKLIIYSYIFLSIFVQPLLAAGVVRDQNRNQQVNVEKAPNGVPIVNINAPNNNGVSHNYFKEYNVENEVRTFYARHYRIGSKDDRNCTA